MNPEFLKNTKKESKSDKFCFFLQASYVPTLEIFFYPPTYAVVVWHLAVLSN